MGLRAGSLFWGAFLTPYFPSTRLSHVISLLGIPAQLVLVVRCCLEDLVSVLLTPGHMGLSIVVAGRGPWACSEDLSTQGLL